MNTKPIYVYDKLDLEDAINEIVEGYGDAYVIELTGTMCARMFHSDMTGMDVAIVSDNKSEVANITDDEFQDWLDNSNDEDFYGLAVADDESGSLGYIKDAVLFTEPLETLIDKYDITEVIDTNDYATSAKNVWYLSPDYFNEGIKVEVVKSSHFRF